MSGLCEQLPLPTAPCELGFPPSPASPGAFCKAPDQRSVGPGTDMSQPPSQRFGPGDPVSLPEPDLQISSCQSSETTPAQTSTAGLRTIPQSRLLDRALLLACTLPALAIAAPVAAINSLRFRSLRKVFFQQERMGRAGETFVLWKFRTLADELDGEGNRLTDQERASRFGRFLRNTHLDELPQIFNVWRGDMSFIGPRPEMISIHSWACDRIPGFPSRLVLRPGITGLAQVTQGYTCQGVQAYERKLEIDHDYIMGRSFLFDLRILAMTAVWMLRGKGWQWKEQSSETKAVGLRALPSQFGPYTDTIEDERRAA